MPGQNLEEESYWEECPGRCRSEDKCPCRGGSQDKGRVRILVLIQPGMLRGISWHAEDPRTNVLSGIRSCVETHLRLPSEDPFWDPHMEILEEDGPPGGRQCSAEIPD